MTAVKDLMFFFLKASLNKTFKSTCTKVKGGGGGGEVGGRWQGI